MFNSFDIFDTIIGRLSFSGTNIFKMIEKKYHIENFATIRQKCETKGIDNIYNRIKKSYPDLSIDWEIIKKYELELEYDLSFPINKYLEMVRPNDILVSDMYLEESDIRKILLKHKLLENKLYVEPAHKSSGQFWELHPEAKKIITHYGDNSHSDYKMAKKFGVNGFHITGLDFLDSEIKISLVSEQLSWIIRAVRLTNQNGNFMNKIFCEIVLPLGILICLYLNIICKNNNINHIIFVSRDGYWFKYIYNILFPQFPTTYFYLSRKMVETNSYGKTIDDIKNIEGKKLIFDLFGTGKTLTDFISKSGLENIVSFMCFNHHKSKMMSIQNLAFRYMQYIDYVESLFSAPHPSVIGYDLDSNPVFKNIEYDVRLLKDYMEGIKTFEKYFNTLNKHIPILSETTNDLELELIKKTIFYMLNIGKHSFIKDIHNLINDNREPDKNYDFNFINPNIKYHLQTVIKFKSNGLCLNLAKQNMVDDINYLVEYLNWVCIDNIDLLNIDLLKDVDLVILDNIDDFNKIEYILEKFNKLDKVIIINK